MQEWNDAPERDQTTQLPAVQSPVVSSQRPRRAMHRCPNCGAINRNHASSCPECGENLRARPQRIRCSQCGKTSSSALVLCPHCGRELVAAPAPWFIWVGSALLILLFLFVIGRWGSLYPLGWVSDRIDAGLTMLNELGESMDPNMVIEATPLPADDAPTPPVEEASATPVAAIAQALITETVVLTDNAGEPMVMVELPTDTPAPTVTPLPTDSPTPEPTLEPTATATEEPTASPTASATTTTAPTEVEPTAAATVAPSRTAVISATRALILLPTPTREITGTAALAASESTTSTVRTTGSRVSTPTATPTVPPTATLTPTPLPTETPTPVPQQVHRIQNGDTLSAIAARYGVTVADLMAVNNISGQAVYTLRPGNDLVIPSEDTPTSQAATNTPAAPTAVPQTYTVQAGDTPIAIANRFGVSVDELLAANALSLADARNLRSGQVLIIPGADTPPAPSSSAPTPAIQAVAVSNSDSQAVRLDQPQLRAPENGAQVSCESGGSLAWLPVDFLRDSDRYVLHLGFVNGVAADGSETIVWVLEQPQAANNTLWNMDVGLCSLAPQEFGRRWYWYVQVIDTATGNVAASEPSPAWWFSWN